MKKCLLLMSMAFGLISPSFSHTPGDSTLAGLFTKLKYEQLFPHHHAIYTYENFLTAAKKYPLFAQDGNLSTRKRELAAFFAQIAHETTNGWPGAKNGPYVWGLYFTEEQACRDGHCSIYNTAGSSKYQPVTGRSYYGRGPIQLSYAYNYGLAGEELGLPLLKHPELVSTNGIIAIETAIWFWMRAQIPKPSCHDIMCGKWHPSASDSLLHRVSGFGMTINIINGGVECNSSDPAQQANRKERIGFYVWFTKMMNISTGPYCDCVGMGTY